ncbi:MAG: hypothetical protein ACTS73_03135 [Arsenophonus sp. NEOnobi-MAG3]
MNILVTRPNLSDKKLIQHIRSLGKIAFHALVIKIMPGNELGILPTKLARLIDGDRGFFLLPNAVRHANSAFFSPKKMA